MRTYKSFVTAMVVVVLSAMLVTGCGAPQQESQTEQAEPATTTVELSPQAQNNERLLADLVAAYETPSDAVNQAVQNDLAAIREQNPQDQELAQSVADHWMSVYVNPNYQMYLYGGGDEATELLATDIPDDDTHAFVVLGYELKDGQMQDELKGRCQTAAAAARTYPDSILVCSGGATGKNNPEKHTEAGLMKDYLVNECGIDESRIFIDERAMTTAENALNTMDILYNQGIQTMTIVTSSYHQRWGQALYNAVATLYRQQQGYQPHIVANYSFPKEPDVEVYKHDDRIAVRQIGEVWGLPKEALELLPAFR